MRAAKALAGSLLSACYWWVMFTIVYADSLFAGDRNPAAPHPSDQDTLLRAGLVVLAAVLGFAALTSLWRRLIDRLAG